MTASGETKWLINRLFQMSVKEDTLGYLQHMFAANVLGASRGVSACTRRSLQACVFDLLNSALHSFDLLEAVANSVQCMHDLCLFCMEDDDNNNTNNTKRNEVAGLFWRLCMRADRDNATVLLAHALDTFPLSMPLTFAFYAMVARASVHTCKQILHCLANMDQFTELLDAIPTDEYVLLSSSNHSTNNTAGDIVRLIRSRKIFGIFFLLFSFIQKNSKPKIELRRIEGTKKHKTGEGVIIFVKSI